MHELRGSHEEQLRDLASHFRKIAAETSWNEYVELFEATAEELDRRAEAERQGPDESSPSISDEVTKEAGRARCAVGEQVSPELYCPACAACAAAGFAATASDSGWTRWA